MSYGRRGSFNQSYSRQGQGDQAVGAEKPKYNYDQKTFYEVRDLASKIQSVEEKLSKMENDYTALITLMQSLHLSINSLLTALNTLLSQIGNEERNENTEQ